MLQKLQYFPAVHALLRRELSLWDGNFHHLPL